MTRASLQRFLAFVERADPQLVRAFAAWQFVDPSERPDAPIAARQWRVVRDDRGRIFGDPTNFDPDGDD